MSPLAKITIRVFFLLMLTSCQKLKPALATMPEYPDFALLIDKQVTLLGTGKIAKEVILDDQHETQFMIMDSARWIKELGFLKEINPNQPAYIGAFKKSIKGATHILSLKEGERGPLKQVNYQLDGRAYNFIEAIFHEDKDVYVHHRHIELLFDKGVISSLNIEGYQKMIFKDTVWFGIHMKIVNPSL